MTPLLVGAALLLGLLWLREHDRRLRETAAATRSLDSLRAAVAASAAETDARHRADSIAAWQTIQARDVALRRARHEADSLAGLAGTLIDSLVSIVPDSLSPFVDRLRASWRADMAARERERAQADSALAARSLRVAQLEAEYSRDMGAVRAQLAEAMHQLGAANRRASPGLWRRVAQTAPWVAGAALAGHRGPARMPRPAPTRPVGARAAPTASPCPRRRRRAPRARSGGRARAVRAARAGLLHRVGAPLRRAGRGQSTGRSRMSIVSSPLSNPARLSLSPRRHAP